MDFSRRPRGFNTPTGKLDFDRTAAALQARALAVCRHLLPAGRKEGHEWRSGDVHGSKGQSLGVHIDGATAGVWKDFSSEQGGADLISLWAAVKGIKQGEAKKEADEWLGIAEHRGVVSIADHMAKGPTASPDSFDWRSRAPDHKWEYRNADGSYFGTVYRWDHPGIGTGKTIRPWDGKKYEAPEGLRPLLFLAEINLPQSKYVLVVEGERKCERLRALGFNATSLWGGSQAVAKTDWSTLAERDVLIWPDNDPAGAAMAKAVTAALQEAGAASVRVCAIPAGKPQKWDAGDATDEEVREIIAAGLASAPRARGYRPLVLTAWKIGDAYQGKPPERRWLVNETFPLGVACGLAAQGDTGKGMLTLDLALKVAGLPSGKIETNPPMSFGCRVSSHGTAVVLSAEDDHGELHRRLAGIDPNHHARGAARDRLIVVPLPSHGGAPALFKNEGGSIDTTDAWDDLLAQLMGLSDLRLVVLDPLASFVRADVNADPGVGAFVCGRFAAMADATGATVLVAQHMAKGSRDRPVGTAEEARHGIRGTSALVDNMRATYALWPMAESHARRLLTKLGRKYAPGVAVMGAVVKANGPADRTVRTYLRNHRSGLLEDFTAQLASMGATKDELLDMLEDEIREAALADSPFTSVGDWGLFTMKAHMSAPELQSRSRGDFEDMLDRLVKDRRVVKCNPANRRGALDVPRGPFALAEATVRRSARLARPKAE